MYIDISTVTTGQLLYLCNILDRFQLHFDQLHVPVGSSQTDRLLEYHEDKTDCRLMKTDAFASFHVTQNENITII
jgi:hypothetical protein